MSIRDIPREQLELGKTRLRPSFDGVFTSAQVKDSQTGTFAGFSDRSDWVLVALPGWGEPLMCNMGDVELAP